MPAAPSHQGLEIQQLGFLRDSKLGSQLSHGDVLQVESLVYTGPEVAICTGINLVHLATDNTGLNHTSLKESNGEKLASLSQAPVVKARTPSCQSQLQRDLGSYDPASWKNP